MAAANISGKERRPTGRSRKAGWTPAGRRTAGEPGALGAGRKDGGLRVNLPSAYQAQKTRSDLANDSGVDPGDQTPD